MNTVPFTIRLRIFPDPGTGRRQELIRSREHIAYLISKDLKMNFGGTIASPGGSGTWLFQSPDGISNLVAIAAVTPQFGESPSTVTITGYFDPTGLDDSVSSVQMETVICANQYVTGAAAGSPGFTTATEPSAALCNQVVELRAQITSAITSVQYDLLSIELAGRRFGVGGRHFPL